MSSRGVPPLPAPPPSGKPFPSFIDIAASAGLRLPLVAGSSSRRYIIEAMGSGVAFLDFDNDGWLDVFLVNGSRLGPAPPGQPKPTSLLYRNNGNGTFTDVSARAGVARTGWGQSVSIADYDNDGFADIFVTYWGSNVLYRNRGNGTFEDL